MPFLTFAQNFEDLMLMRGLKNVKNGFYIDVGANHPTDESVTRVFYDAGWSGINIEPDPVPFAELVKARPRDINLNIGVWSEPCVKTFSIVKDCSALSTTSDYLMQAHREAGRPMRTVELQMTDLRTICARHVKREVHFMKVDVEGVEEHVFLGHDFKACRPWIILFEACGPDPTATFYLPAHNVVTANNYEDVYFDGLNRFYVANEKLAELKHAFLAPPNAYDDWIRYRDIRWAPPGSFPQFGI